MKTRNGFVSNSSSSSFVIVYHENSESCPTCGRKPFQIQEMVQREENYDYSGDTALLGVGYHEVLKKIQEDYDYRQDDLVSMMDKLAQCKKDHPDWKFLYFDLSHQRQDYIQSEMDIMKDHGKLIYILNEDG